MAIAKPAPKAAPKPAPKAAAPAPAPKVAAPAAAAAKPAAEKPAAVAAMAVDTAGIEAGIRNAAAKTLEQGKAAYEKMKEATDEATQTIEASFAATSKGATELASKAFEAAKTNANATFDHLKALAASKTLSDAVTLHGQFIRAQAEAAVAQAKELAELAKKTAEQSSAPIQAQLKKTLSSKA